MNGDLNEPSSSAAVAAEQARQQALLAALWAPAATLPSGVRDATSARSARGLRAYRAHAGHAAERVLQAQCPTVAALVGEEALAAIARACWRRHPPDEGDIACFADALPTFLGADPQLADCPYLADVARLDLAMNAAEAAADADAEEALHTLSLLESHAPPALRLRLAPGSALIPSVHPVVSIRQAHETPGPHDFGSAGAECAWVWRAGFKACVCAIDPAGAAFVAACLQGHDLERALAAAGEGWNFESWLLDALRRRQLLGAQAL
jgi:hypothetical protein